MSRDYREIALRAMRKDLARNGVASVRQPPSNGYKRIKSVAPTSSYYQYRRFLIGKLIKKADDTFLGEWYSFVNDNDSKALNQFAGWNESKKTYLFDCVTLE